LFTTQNLIFALDWIREMRLFAEAEKAGKEGICITQNETRQSHDGWNDSKKRHP